MKKLDVEDVKNSKTAFRFFDELNSVWSDESALRTRTTILILRELERLRRKIK